MLRNTLLRPSLSFRFPKDRSLSIYKPPLPPLAKKKTLPPTIPRPMEITNPKVIHPPPTKVLTVKRSPETPSSSTSVGTLKRRRSHHDPLVRDRSNQVLLQRSAHGLDILNVRALLHAHAYLRGTELHKAALQLQQGKQDVYRVLQALDECVLVGHGIPTQLLEHVVDLGDQLLDYHADAVCVFVHTPRTPVSNLREFGSTQVWLEGWYRVSDKALPWPPRDDWQDAMQLLVTVLVRIAYHLQKTKSSTTVTTIIDDYDNEFASQTQSPKHLRLQVERVASSSTRPRVKVSWPHDLVRVQLAAQGVQWTMDAKFV